MKKGICSFAFPADMTLKEVFIKAKKFGFDGVELSMEKTGELTPDTTDEEIANIRKNAEEAGIELYSITTSLYWTASLTADSEEERKLAKSYAVSQIKLAEKLGIKNVLVVPGHVGVCFAPKLGVVDYDKAYERALAVSKELAVYAEKSGVTVGLENVWNKFLLSPLEMKDFIDKINSPYVKAYFDVGNVLSTGYPEQWVRLLSNRITKVHFKDFNLKTNMFCELLDGDVNYSAVMKALRDIGYDGWVTAEYGAVATDNDAMLERISCAMNNIINC